MSNIENFLALVHQVTPGKKHLVVAAPHDVESLLAVEQAREEGLVEAILVGEQEQIGLAAKQAGIDLSAYRTHAASGGAAIADRAVSLVAAGEGDLLMKGLIDTSDLLKALLNKKYNLRTGQLFSHVGLLLPPGKDNYYLLTDAGMNIAPSLQQKQQIVENAVSVAHALGNPKPNVAMLCAKEKPYDPMPATLDAARLQELNRTGEIGGCTVSGPLQLDLAISADAAAMKGCTDPVAGQADILMVPSIEVGNVFGKALKYMAGFTYAGVVLGARIPVVLVSRADSKQEKLLSIALACACCATPDVDSMLEAA